MTRRRAVEETELAALTAEWGEAPHLHFSLDVKPPFLSGNHQTLASNGRRAEICYVMHRGDPAQGLLLHIKAFYPDGGFRLPTGGIHMGEGVYETLVREIDEETGLQVGPGEEEVRVERFLGVISYDLHHSELGVREFATYHFLVCMPPDATLNPQDADEQIAGWQWRPPSEMNAVAATLEDVGASDPGWADWGRFRALSHRFVATALGH